MNVRYVRLLAMLVAGVVSIGAPAAAQEPDPTVLKAPNESDRPNGEDRRPRFREDRPRDAEHPPRGGRMRPPILDDAAPSIKSPIGLPGPPHRRPHDEEGPRRAPAGLFERELAHLREHDPEMYELEIADRDLEKRTFELAQLLRQAPPDKRAELKAELSAEVKAHFDARQKRRMLQLKRLEEELQRLRESIERREQSRDEIIGRRISELVGEEHDLGF